MHDLEKSTDILLLTAADKTWSSQNHLISFLLIDQAMSITHTLLQDEIFPG